MKLGFSLFLAWLVFGRKFAVSSMRLRASVPVPASRIVLHHRNVADPPPLQRQFERLAGPEGMAVVDYGWADGSDARVRNAYRATAQ